jgi:hypothetical protein
MPTTQCTTQTADFYSFKQVVNVYIKNISMLGTSMFNYFMFKKETLFVHLTVENYVAQVIWTVGFIHDSVVFRVQFVLVYTLFCCIQGSVCAGLCMILLYSGYNWTLNTTESCINQYKLNPEYNRIMYKPVQTESWIQQNHV